MLADIRRSAMGKPHFSSGFQSQSRGKASRSEATRGDDELRRCDASRRGRLGSACAAARLPDAGGDEFHAVVSVINR